MRRLCFPSLKKMQSSFVTPQFLPWLSGWSCVGQAPSAAANVAGEHFRQITASFSVINHIFIADVTIATLIAFSIFIHAMPSKPQHRVAWLNAFFSWTVMVQNSLHNVWLSNDSRQNKTSYRNFCVCWNIVKMMIGCKLLSVSKFGRHLKWNDVFCSSSNFAHTTNAVTSYMVYAFWSPLTGHSYIGQTIRGEVRFREHLSLIYSDSQATKNHFCVHKKIKELGLGMFIWMPVFCFEHASTQWLLRLEHALIRSLRSSWNSPFCLESGKPRMIVSKTISALNKDSFTRPRTRVRPWSPVLLLKCIQDPLQYHDRATVYEPVLPQKVPLTELALRLGDLRGQAKHDRHGQGGWRLHVLVRSLSKKRPELMPMLLARIYNVLDPFQVKYATKRVHKCLANGVSLENWTVRPKLPYVPGMTPIDMLQVYKRQLQRRFASSTMMLAIPSTMQSPTVADILTNDRRWIKGIDACDYTCTCSTLRRMTRITAPSHAGHFVALGSDCGWYHPERLSAQDLCCMPHCLHVSLDTFCKHAWGSGPPWPHRRMQGGAHQLPISNHCRLTQSRQIRLPINQIQSLR